MNDRTADGINAPPVDTEEAVTPVYGASEILDVAVELGAELFHYGGEVHRVEDTIARICTAYGAVSSDIFVIPSLIDARIVMPSGETADTIRRMTRAYNHLSRQEAINSLSRKICERPMPPEYVRDELEKIRHLRPIPKWLCVVGGMLATGSFCVFFGGDILDGLCASVIGAGIVMAQRITPRRIRIGELGRVSVISFCAGLLAVLSTVIGLGHNLDKIIIGTIMLEVPGLAFGGAIRDLLCGDTLSGTLRIIQSVLRTLVMALSYMAALALASYFIPGGVAL